MKKETETPAPLFSENSPFNDLCGLEITERRGGHCTVACRTGENHLNPYGIVHGGLLFTMMDVAGGYAARTLDSGETIRCVTQNASTVFLHPGKPGTLTAEAASSWLPCAFMIPNTAFSRKASSPIIVFELKLTAAKTGGGIVPPPVCFAYAFVCKIRSSCRHPMRPR